MGDSQAIYRGTLKCSFHPGFANGLLLDFDVPSVVLVHHTPHGKADPFDILPPPILSHIAKILLVNAQANNKCCPYCEAKMDDQKERLPQWCKDLSSLSMASQYLRFELWTSSLDELALNADENLNRLEDIMTDYMKTFVTYVAFPLVV